jgi:type II secretory pathway pseudopilin PulG
VRGNKADAFTIIELALVLGIAGLFFSLMIGPLITTRKQSEIAFTQELNQLVHTAYEQALVSHVTHRVLFNFDQELISIEQASGMSSSYEQTFKPLQLDYEQTTLDIPPGYETRNFYVQGSDVMAGSQANEAWFYIVPEGLAQAVIINMIDTDAQTRLSFVLNPLRVIFEVLYEFQRPDAVSA